MSCWQLAGHICEPLKYCCSCDRLAKWLPNARYEAFKYVHSCKCNAPARNGGQSNTLKFQAHAHELRQSWCVSRQEIDGMTATDVFQSSLLAILSCYMQVHVQFYPC